MSAGATPPPATSALRVLVVGGTGFVGSRLVPALRARGHQVSAAGRHGGDVAVDVCDPVAVRRMLDGGPPPDVVVHLAAIAHRERGGVAGNTYDEVNHRGVRNVLGAARAVGVPRFVLYSSANVYGHEGRPEPVCEEAERRPVGAYAQSKRDAEDACFEAAGAGYPCVVLRFPAIYSEAFLRNLRARACVPGTAGRLLLRVAGRQPRYSLCAVENAVAATEMAVEGRLEPGVYNVADCQPYTHHDVANAVGAVDGTRLSVPVPRWGARAALLAAAALLPGERGELVRSDYWKLFEGLVLDDARVRAAGFQPRDGLRDLVRRASAG